MKNAFKLRSGLFKAVIAVALACPLTVSCYDDSKLWEWMSPFPAAASG